MRKGWGVVTVCSTGTDWRNRTMSKRKCYAVYCNAWEVATLTLADELRAVAEWLKGQGEYLHGWEEEEGRNFGSQEYATKAANLRALAAKCDGKVLVNVSVGGEVKQDKHGRVGWMYSAQTDTPWVEPEWGYTSDEAVANLQALLDGDS